MRASRFPQLYDREKLTALLAAGDVGQVASDLGCSTAHVYIQARKLGVEQPNRGRRPFRKAGRQPAKQRKAGQPIRLPNQPADEAMVYEPADVFERLEIKRVAVARKRRGRGEMVMTANGLKRLVRAGTGALTRAEERLAVERRDADLRKAMLQRRAAAEIADGGSAEIVETQMERESA